MGLEINSVRTYINTAGGKSTSRGGNQQHGGAETTSWRYTLGALNWFDRREINNMGAEINIIRAEINIMKVEINIIGFSV